MNLWAYFQNNEGPLINKWKHYFPVYERHFRHFVNRPVIFLEIGVYHGGSLKMWKHYFGPHARIIGIDILTKCKQFEEDQIAVRIGKQQDRGFLQSVLDEFGSPDIVLDDGSHLMSEVTASFRYLYPRVAKNGVYVVEDLHTSYWEEFQGGLRKASSFIEICKGLVDELHAEHSRGALAPTDFTNTTLSMHFYDGMVVFERGSHTKKMALEIGNKTLHSWDTLPGRLSRRIEGRYRPWTAVKEALPQQTGRFQVRLDDETETEAVYDAIAQQWQVDERGEEAVKGVVAHWRQARDHARVPQGSGPKERGGNSVD